MQESNYRFMKWLDQSRDNIRYRREQKLLSQNRIAHRNKGFFSSQKVVESFVAPPTFLLYLWAAFPLLFIATFQTDTIIACVIATIISFFLIHIDTYYFVRYLMSGFVLLIVLALYHFKLI